MRTITAALLAAALLATAALADEKDGARKKKAAEQLKVARTAWESLGDDEPATLETKNLLVLAPKALSPRLKAVGALLEDYHDRALKALKFDAAKEPYPGKVTVYLLKDKEQATAFIRRVDRRRPEPGEAASFSATDERLHAAACPGAGKNALSAEALAGEQLASLLLTRRAGRGTQVPDWLVTGFGRATTYRALPKHRAVADELKLGRALARRRGAADVHSGTVEAEESVALGARLADFLAYGPGAARFGKLIDAFKPGENMLTKTTAQAMEAAGISAANVERLWRTWSR